MTIIKPNLIVVFSIKQIFFKKIFKKREIKDKDDDEVPKKNRKMC